MIDKGKVKASESARRGQKKRSNQLVQENYQELVFAMAVKKINSSHGRGESL